MLVNNMFQYVSVEEQGFKPPRVVGSIPTWSYAGSKDRVIILSAEIAAADILGDIYSLLPCFNSI